jgi:hypothetical protein
MAGLMGINYQLSPRLEEALAFSNRGDTVLRA